MTRDWACLYVATLHKPKYRRLSVPGRAALLHVWMLAGEQDPEATWANREELADQLNLDGYPAEVLDELLVLRWLDTAPDGTVSAHDWDEWQFAATKAGKARWEAHYMREWRKKRRQDAQPLPPGPPTPEEKRDRDIGVNNVQPHVNNNGTGSWDDYGPEWDEVRRLSSRWTKYPPSGTPGDDWNVQHPSQRAVVAHALDEQPTVLLDLVQAGDSWFNVVAGWFAYRRQVAP